MATLYKRPGSDFWYAKFYDAHGKRLSRNTGETAKQKAKTKAASIEAEARGDTQASKALGKQYAFILETAAREAQAGELTLARAEELLTRLHQIANPDYEVVSLEKYWKDWIREQSRHVVQNTVNGYHGDYNILSAALGKRVMSAPVGALTTDQINTAVDLAKKTGNRRGSTVNKALSSLRRVMEAAVVAKLATRNPAKQSRMLLQTDSADRAPFSVEEVQAMMDHPKTSPDWRGAILFGAHTALRLSDVLVLGRQNIEGESIVIMPRKTARKKKVLRIPLSKPCLEWIGNRKGDFFPSLKAQKTSLSSGQFIRIMERAGVPKKIVRPGGLEGVRSFHSLRHTFTSWLAEADIPADVRQKLTGHVTHGMHARYTHHDSALGRAIDALPAIAVTQ